MAGATLTLDITSDDLTPLVKRLLTYREARNGLDEVLGDINEYLVRSTRDRATKEVDPSGKAWAPLSPGYKKWKDKKRPGVPILKFDFHMLGDQLSGQVVDHEGFVGTNAKYGAIHQFGGETTFAARSQYAYFKQDKRTGQVGNRFVKKSKSNFAQGVTLPEYTVRTPARPWLGLSTEDEKEVLAILGDHLLARLKPAGGGSA